MKTYTVTKKDKETKIMADSIEEAKQIYNDSIKVNDDDYINETFEFGKVKLYVKKNAYHDKKYDGITINWPALGSVNLKEAEKFANDILKAVDKGRKYEKQ
ncbi:MAG: hypothetical protein M0Q88_01125 [Bacilli bacterium]|nr:hypothetical protein [Bacilli bacterium]